MEVHLSAKEEKKKIALILIQLNSQAVIEPPFHTRSWARNWGGKIKFIFNT